MQKPVSYLKTLILAVLVIIIASISTILYNQSLDKNLSQTIYVRVEEAILQQKSNMVLDINSDMAALNNIGQMVARSTTREDAFQIVREMKENTKFDNIFLVNLEGVGKSQDGTVVDVSDRDYFQSALKGDITVGEPVISKATGLVVTPIASPMYIDGDLQYIIVGSYTIQKVQSLLLDTFGGTGRTDVATVDGDIIATSRTLDVDESTLYDLNIFSKLGDPTKPMSQEVKKAKEDFSNKESGYITVVVDGIQKHTYYTPLGINDWYIILTVDHNVVAQTAMRIKRDSTFVAGAIMLCLALVFIYIYRSNKRYTDMLYGWAFYDELTGLPNLKKFKEEVNDIIAQNPTIPFSCIVFDVRNFKFINDTYGSSIGDKVLKTIAQTSEEFVVKNQMGVHTLSRLYTDTFALFLPLDNSEIGDLRREEFVRIFTSAIDYVDDYKIDLSIGRYLMQSNEDADIILEKATLAHTRAQTLPANRFVLYEEEHRESFKAAVNIRNRVDEALKNEEFVVFLQPKYYINSDTICGAEALVRWKQGNGYLFPDSFIPIMERNGMIVQLDLFIFEKCCQLLKQWEQEGRVIIPISVNFARNHLTSNDLPDKLCKIIEKYGVNPADLIVEITETATVDHKEYFSEIVHQLHEHGFKVSMDDFGSGYSSLGFINEVQVDEIKLDRSLISKIDIDNRAKFVVKNIVSLANDLGTTIVAEGLETKEQKEVLKALDCAVAQGYLYSAPVPCDLIFSNNAVVPSKTALLNPFHRTCDVNFTRE